MFSKTAEYALRATIYIAQKSSEENKLGIDEIAKSIDAPKSFTAKILQLLTRNNELISSVRGPNGGFYITEKAKGLSIRTILETIKEDDVFTKCVLGLKACSEAQPCPMHFQYKPIKQQLIRLFETKTIRDLAKELKTGERFLANFRPRKKTRTAK
jgi:Rrf2 family transcriptional regulator, iron-sulfur cluster assembly transcription factor